MNQCLLKSQAPNLAFLTRVKKFSFLNVLTHKAAISAAGVILDYSITYWNITVFDDKENNPWNPPTLGKEPKIWLIFETPRQKQIRIHLSISAPFALQNCTCKYLFRQRSFKRPQKNPDEAGFSSYRVILIRHLRFWCAATVLKPCGQQYSFSSHPW